MRTDDDDNDESFVKTSRSAVRKVLDTLKEARRLGLPGAHTDAMANKIKNVKRRLEDLSVDLTIGFTGRVNAGKTTLINCLTADPDNNKYCILREDILRTTINIEGVLTQGGIAEQGHAFYGHSLYETNSLRWKDIMWCDTPGIDENDRDNEKVVEIVERLDVIAYVVSLNDALSLSERKFLRTVANRFGTGGGLGQERQVIIIANYSERFTSTGIARKIQDLKGKVNEDLQRHVRVFPVALQDLIAARGDADAYRHAHKSSGLPKLEAYFESLQSNPGFKVLSLLSLFVAHRFDSLSLALSPWLRRAHSLSLSHTRSLFLARCFAVHLSLLSLSLCHSLSSFFSLLDCV